MKTFEIIRGTIILIVFVILAVLVLRHWMKRSKDEPAVLALKWAVTGFLLVVSFVAIPMLGPFAPFLIVFCGIVLSLMWTANLVGTLLRPLWHALDGGDEEPEPRPLYSIPRALCKKGRYAEALANVRAQLVRFPNDLEGQLLVAEILAENMNDVEGAEIAIQRLVAQPGHAPRNLAFALNSLADWHLKYTQDREAAQRAFERIQELCPDSELSLAAAQRIAHLADAARLIAPHDRQRVPMRKGVDNLGLLMDSAALKPVEVAPGEQAASYVEHLTKHPLDSEAREKLAILYADHYQRLDLAGDQLNQLIEQPNQPPKQVAHWLNLLADLHVRHGANFDAAWVALGRIIEKFPEHSVAELARNRMGLLRLEIKGQEKSQAVKLGSYEQNIGLKRGLPKL